jgi:hypothetical protein
MPNGGSDDCGTCWFNARNKGEAGYAHAQDPEPDFCTIRGLAIEDPFYTYCCNHPHRRPDRDPLPVGPVFVDREGSGGREIWQSSPDSEEIRLHLLDLVGRIEQEASDEYPMGSYLDEVVVWQLGEFRESRAAADLTRIAALSPRPTYGRARRTRASEVALAHQALNKIEPSRLGETNVLSPQPKWWQFWKRTVFQKR